MYKFFKKQLPIHLQALFNLITIFITTTLELQPTFIFQNTGHNLFNAQFDILVQPTGTSFSVILETHQQHLMYSNIKFKYSYKIVLCKLLMCIILVSLLIVIIGSFSVISVLLFSCLSICPFVRLVLSCEASPTQATVYWDIPPFHLFYVQYLSIY